MRLLEKNPRNRISAADALLHPWIVEKVKLRSLREKWKLYPEISIEEKMKCDECIAIIKGQDKLRPYIGNKI